MYYAHTLKKPMQWRASGTDDKPLYFGCCDCGQADAVIKGFLSAKEQPEFGDILIVPRQDGFVSLALYCAGCWGKIEGGNDSGTQIPTE